MQALFARGHRLEQLLAAAEAGGKPAAGRFSFAVREQQVADHRQGTVAVAVTGAAGGVCGPPR